MTEAMRRTFARRGGPHSCVIAIALIAAACGAHCQAPQPGPAPSFSPGTQLAQLILQIQGKAKILESSSGMQFAYQKFTSAHNLTADSVRYSDFVIVRLLFRSHERCGFLEYALGHHEPAAEFGFDLAAVEKRGQSIAAETDGYG